MMAAGPGPDGKRGLAIRPDEERTYRSTAPTGRETMPATQHRNLGDQKALVTGATSGLGRAIALQLARDGAEVVVHGRDEARGAETVEAIRADGGRARFVAADLGDPADIQRPAEAAGHIHILVNNAGFSARGPTAELA